MSYDKRIVHHSPATFVAESEAMGVTFMLDKDTVLVAVCGTWLPSHDPIVVYANRAEVVDVLKQRATTLAPCEDGLWRVG